MGNEETELVERLRETEKFMRLELTKHAWSINDVELYADACDRLGKASSTIERLEHERDALREALRPFAEEANRIHPDWANERRRSTLTPSKELTVADFRRARAALLHEGQG